MSIKPSHTLLAALAVIAGPAFAQDSAAPEADAPATDSIVQMPAGTEDATAKAEEMADEARDAADEAENAVQDAADEMTGATDTSDAGDDAAASETPTAEDATSAEEASEEEATAHDGAESETSESTEGESTSGDEATADGATNEDSQPAADSESATPETDEAAPAEAAAGESDEPEIGEYYAKSTHQDWTIRCIKAEEGVDPCELYQLLQDSDGNSVAEMTLIPLENGDVSAGATLVAPLETDLTRGLSVSIDNGEVRGYPFSFCAPVGCVSRMGFTAPELSELKRGAGATVSLLPFGADAENPVNLDLSLSGFTAAFDEMSSLAAEARAAAEAQAGSNDAPAE